MLSRPTIPTWASTSSYYGMGWSVRPVGGDANWWHNGSLPGTATLLVREGQTPYKLSWAALFNSRAQFPSSNEFSSALDRALWQAVREVTEWPTHDLFGQYP